MIGLGMLCGIGFTMSLFIGSLAFARSPLHYTESVIGVLMALFAIFPFLLAIPAGRLADRRGYHLPARLAAGLALAGAVLAAGNRAMIKPSEFTPATSELMAVMFSSVFSEEEIAVITGGPEIGEAFLRMMGVNQIANPLKPPQVDPKPQDGAKL